MRVLSAVFGLLAIGVMFNAEAQAEFLLNCRLMNPHNPDYKRYCLGSATDLECIGRTTCTTKIQNFGSLYLTRAKSSRITIGSTGVVGSTGSALSGATGSVSGAGAVAGTAGGIVGGALSGLGSDLGVTD